MKLKRIAVGASLALMVLLPVDAQASIFCDEIKQAAADARNSFNHVAPPGAFAEARLHLPGFDGCNVTRDSTPTFMCMTQRSNGVAVEDELRACLSDWSMTYTPSPTVSTYFKDGVTVTLLRAQDAQQNWLVTLSIRATP